VRAVLLSRQAFLSNKRGFPCLSKRHQQFLARCFRHNIQVPRTWDRAPHCGVSTPTGSGCFTMGFMLHDYWFRCNTTTGLHLHPSWVRFRIILIHSAPLDRCAAVRKQEVEVETSQKSLRRKRPAVPLSFSAFPPMCPGRVDWPRGESRS
jgi:hypothetical protein